MNEILNIGIFVSLFLMYWCLISKLINSILDGPKFKIWHWSIVGAVNLFILCCVWMLHQNALLLYGVMSILMLIDFLIFYKDSKTGALLCMLACVIHDIIIFLITLGAYIFLSGKQSFEVLDDPQFFLWYCIVCFAIIDLAIIVVLKVIPLNMVKIINQHKEQQIFIISWMAVCNIFLIYMGLLFYKKNYPSYLAFNQMLFSFCMLIGLYIMLFFSIKNSQMLAYKEKSIELDGVILKEQEYRNFMKKDAYAYYEINVTKNELIVAQDEDQINCDDISTCYSDTLIILSQKLILSEDIPEFVKLHTCSNLIRLYQKGQRELISEYRRLCKKGDYIWIRTIVQLVEDIVTGDIKAYAYLKNIDHEKKEQLELKRRAETDSLTGLYNRSIATKMINEYFAFEHSQQEAALFMIDVDNFKDVNDHLGHIYGDAVLCELADKLLYIFGEKGIVGRIGGDEFVVLLKNYIDVNEVVEKAKEICKEFSVTYQGTEGESISISSSIGISLFPRDGKKFEDLYGCADIALYSVKNEGKNSYKIFDGSKFSSYTSKRTEIQLIDNVSQKSFRENRIEYVFKMLYQNDNPVAAIHSVLELIARHFSFDRGYIFENSYDGKTTSNTFEWCAEGITPEINNLQNVPSEMCVTAFENFKKYGAFILKSLYELHPLERAVLEPQGIKSMFQFALFDKNKLLGFIGFDNCVNQSIPNDNEIDEMKTICEILSTFFVKKYLEDASKNNLIARQEVMNNLENYIYIVQSDTLEILFMNKKAKDLANLGAVGSTCHNYFRGKDKQCDDCPIKNLDNRTKGRVVSKIYNKKLDIWLEATASLVHWTDGNLACLINCFDITKQKENALNVDPLTGIRTYHKFLLDGQVVLDNQPEQLHYLVKFDIANFKLINGQHGFDKGNEVLRNVAKAIEYTVRNEDEIFGRVSNDEFVVLFTVESELEIEQLYETFKNNFQNLMGKDFLFKCKFPHGRFIIEPDNKKHMNLHEMFEKVNMAHKAAKLSKTIEYVYYNEEMTIQVMRTKEIENRMENALLNQEFCVYLQPKYFLEDETIGGAEALTRWESDNISHFYPDSFIPIFEQNGFITKLDFYIFEKTCEIIKGWIEDGITPIKVSVNFSRIHLSDKNFVKHLCEISDKVGVERKYLEIEITETVIFDNIETFDILIKDIHNSGFSMSMDDFGSGYSSLGMLKDLAFDVLKIDRSFFVNQRDINRTKIVVNRIIQMATDLGIRIVAEGIEEQEQIDLLRELHCDMVQGYYYAKPMPLKDFTKLLKNE